MQTLSLRPNQERRLLAGHVWVYANEVDVQATPLRGFEPGSEVVLRSSRGRSLGSALVNPHALICARRYSERVRPFDDDLLRERLRSALGWRERLYPEPWYRLAYGDSDGLPGLVADRYDDQLVVQVSTAAMEARLPVVLDWAFEELGVCRVVLRNDGQGRGLEDLPAYVRIEERGPASEVATARVPERGLHFHVDLLAGQKTGWFYDQRPNRERWSAYCRGARRVLDVFAYVGAWSLPLAAEGVDVTLIDRSADALDLAMATARDHGCEERVHAVRGDAVERLEALVAAGERFDAVVLDPPALVRRRKDLGRGMDAYRRLQRLAARLLLPDGVLASCSCSLPVTEEHLLDALRRGSGRRAPLVAVGSGMQAPDHPVLPAVAETRYLTCLYARRLPDGAPDDPEEPDPDPEPAA
jgi:23S rRNA (cytosine1962-C5)-methyltransferase